MEKPQQKIIKYKILGRAPIEYSAWSNLPNKQYFITGLTEIILD